MRKEIEKTETITLITCDKCEQPTHQKCEICKCDVCWRCSIQLETSCDLMNPGFQGDYPEYICNDCWDSGKNIREEIMKIRNEAEDKEIELWKQWKDNEKARKNRQS